jgi:hypothetical protein
MFCGEVPQVCVRVPILLTGDLALGHFLDEFGRTQSDRRRRKFEARQLILQRREVGIQLVSERNRRSDISLLPQQILDAVPAGPRWVGLVGEVVHSGVDGAVDLLHQAGDRLDGLPMETARRERCLGGVDVARPHSVGEDRGLVDERRDLVVHVGPIFVYGREDYSVLGATAEILTG